jgi:hypothetical protein
MSSPNLIITPTEEDLEKLRGYKIGKWKDRKHYMCIYCQYSTLWMSKMTKHQAEDSHPWAFPGQNPKPVGEAREYDEPDY